MLGAAAAYARGDGARIEQLGYGCIFRRRPDGARGQSGRAQGRTSAAGIA